MLRIYLTNLGKYNEGYLIGEWVTLPADDYELEQVKERIGINRLYEEIFITDYESDIDGFKVDEFEDIDKLNEIAEMLEELNPDIDILSALLSDGYDIEQALNKIDDCIVYSDCYTLADVAEEICAESGILNSIPEPLRPYFDFEAYGRDLSFEITFIFLDGGKCVEILK